MWLFTHSFQGYFTDMQDFSSASELILGDVGKLD